MKMAQGRYSANGAAQCIFSKTGNTKKKKKKKKKKKNSLYIG
jgi:hypothetical protein